MDLLLSGKILFLLLAANGAPILGRILLGVHLNYPVDGQHRLADGQPIFGISKTWRGIGIALLLTPLLAALIALPPLVGILIATLAMIGDLLSSFIKRRLGIEPSGMAFGLDQLPESLLPLIAVGWYYGMDWRMVLGLAIVFLILELVLSRILYWLNIRKQPY